MRAGMQPAGQMGAHKAAGFALKLCASSLCFMSGCGLIATTTARVLHQFVAQLSASCACAVPRLLLAAARRTSQSPTTAATAG